MSTKSKAGKSKPAKKTTKAKDSASNSKADTSTADKSAADTSTADTSAGDKGASDASSAKDSGGANDNGGDSGSDSDSDSDSSKSKSDGGSSSSRSISYFSSVSTDDYRDGWAAAFATSKTATKRKAVNGGVARARKKPQDQAVTLEITAGDLDAATQAALAGQFQQAAKKQRLNYNKLETAGRVSWRLVCEIAARD